MKDTTCIKCGCLIQQWVRSDNIKCKQCGALYKLSSSDAQDQAIEYSYDFVGFNCIHSSISGDCDKFCPAPRMYCKEHVSDESFENINKQISYAEDRVKALKEDLECMQDSKKTWLIQKVSGIDEDSSV